MSLSTDLAAARPSRWTRAVLGLSALFVLAFAATHVLRPGLDPSWTPISEHAIGEQGAVMTIAFLALAAACGALFVAWRRALKGWQGVVARIGLVLGFLGFALAAIFPGDSVLATPQTTTVAGMVHGVGAVLADGVPLAALFAAWSMTRAGGVQGRQAGLMWLGAGISVSGFVAVVVVMATFMPASGRLGPEVPIGWAGRYMMATHVIWLVIAAWVQARVERAGAAA
ncbi:DUF998 domain-containing protein [Caulobacter mirabilis]|uniref:DUF998 domain-containing protein n=1 Tax=Caulobacter mirabilis TaxID=69666 RepID=A0A2D2B0C6_9CAUL|nr:DUF998 domain-containing protein [Caulobacter mirabilis]ATQ43691.1 hypothetical protein CSW64_15470 [Caulobacter mirabilis]